MSENTKGAELTEGQRAILDAVPLRDTSADLIRPAQSAGEPAIPFTPVVVEDGGPVPATGETVATPEGDRGPDVYEGADVTFFGQAHEDGQPAKIVKVWTPGCVNLDNGKTSVPVFRLGTSDPMPTSYFCVLASDVPPAVAAGPDLSGNVRPAIETTTQILPDPLYLANYQRLERAQALPEVPQDEPLHEIQYAEGSIEFFVASETDRRRMRIVAARGGFASQYAPEDADQEGQHG